MKLEKGNYARVICGRDKGEIYLVSGIAGNNIYLINGKNRTVLNPKKKNRKHIQPIGRLASVSLEEAGEVRRILDEYENGR